MRLGKLFTRVMVLNLGFIITREVVRKLEIRVGVVGLI